MPAPKTDLLKTPLYDLHLKLGARMVPFAGYEMPVQYSAGIKTEHLHCRAQAGLFDVSHMGQLVVKGPWATAELEKIIPVDLEALQINQQSYGLFTNEQGGILDDLIITKWAEDCFFLVVNADCKKQDIAHLKSNLSDNTELSELADQALLALQGPKAAEVIADLWPEAASLKFMNGLTTRDAYITRSGYTGEDGFEISCPADTASEVAEKLLSYGQVEAIGLGARDSLRLESGLCLYGHDMDAQSTPIEAGLGWSISKSRRSGGAKEGNFPGSEIILKQMNAGAARKRVGLDIEGRAPVREGAVIEDTNGNKIGIVTSGGFSPTLKKPIAMGYVDSAFSKIDTPVNAIVRDKARPSKICKLPFVTPNYFRG